MKERKFAIISMTTFGNKPNPLRIVQLSISKLRGDYYEPIFTTNINPEERLPNYIQQKTGLTDTILLKAPTFSEVANTILQELENHILVGHNASFLHYALQSEFKYLGYSFKTPQLCTVRLAKKLIPNMTSYELPYLSGVLNIPYTASNDLNDDNAAVAILFQRLILLDDDEMVISKFLEPKVEKERIAPKNIAYQKLNALPNSPGIYKFQDKKGEVTYVGKAKDIKKRVLSHFYNTSEKEITLCDATYHIDFEPTGSELIALLREADLIDKLDPPFNYIQKKSYVTYHIVPQKNRKGVLQLKIERRPFVHSPTEIFLKRGDAIKRLIALTEKFRLCPLQTGLKSKLGRCTHGEYTECDGICAGEEEIGQYNLKVENALDYLNNENDNYVLFEKGRTKEERSFVLILHGVYQGYGFLDNSQSVSSLEHLKDMLDPKKHSYHTAKIISSYTQRNPWKIKPLETNGMQ
ncbi:exonuclease domain-containing protein [Maribacter sp. SA7]|uniref:exonuclease domain-containing protein n=1 Tax=Maribacter zhoushanensis TaxID=3030012 RepID=UPI0023EBA2E4|nr:exonuclease domain-containing protein [Maribacter zhoushanensis]MDF4203888.1 exonuclease domain-containing protein [Maribacter zhoushanensis]